MAELRVAIDENDRYPSFSDLLRGSELVFREHDPQARGAKWFLKEVVGGPFGRMRDCRALFSLKGSIVAPMVVANLVADVISYYQTEFSRRFIIQGIFFIAAQGESIKRQAPNRILKAWLGIQDFDRFRTSVTQSIETPLIRSRDGLLVSWESDDLMIDPLDENLVGCLRSKLLKGQELTEAIELLIKKLWPQIPSNSLIRDYIAEATRISYEKLEFLEDWSAFWDGNLSDTELNQLFSKLLIR